VKTVVRTAGGSAAPRLRKPPVFSAYVRRSESPKKDCVGLLASNAVAACFVTLSQPIVDAITSARNATRTPVLIDSPKRETPKTALAVKDMLRAWHDPRAEVSRDGYRSGHRADRLVRGEPIHRETQRIPIVLLRALDVYDRQFWDGWSK